MNPTQGDQKPETENNTTPDTPSDSSVPLNSPTDQSSPTQDNSENSLEDNSGSKAGSKSSTEDNKQPSATDPVKPVKASAFGKVVSTFKKFDIYFLIFIFLMVVSLIIAYVAIQKNKTAKQVGVSTQTLDQNALKQINSNDTQVGGTNQTLDVQSNTVFGGNVLVKNSLQVAGSLKVAGTLSLPGITVSGTTDLGQVNATTLTLTGAETVKGQLTVDQGLTVNGIAAFSGPLNAAAITVTSLEVNGDMTFDHHIYTTGSIPKATSTSALGVGGTSSVNGSDTAGNVNVNTGVGASSGCLVDIAFAQSYATVPFVVITPVGENSGNPNLGIYITTNFSGFSICSINPTSDTPMSFDYEVIG